MLKLKKYPTRSPFYYVRGTVAGQSIFESTGTSDRGQAEAYRRKREKETFDTFALGIQRPVTFSEAAIVYMNGGGEKKRLRNLIERFGHMTFAEIGQAEIDDTANALYPHAKASTINRQFINPFISVARSAIHAELPGAILRPIQRRKVAKVTVTPASDAHINALLPFCDDKLSALILLMTFTGLRTGEAIKVTAGDVRDGFVHVAQTKNGEPRQIPAPDGWACPIDGFGFTTTQGVGRALRRAHKRAGLPYRDGHEIGRHAFAARWLANGGTLAGLMKAGNWKKYAVVAESYGHMEKADVHKTMRDLSKIRANRVKL